MKSIVNLLLLLTCCFLFSSSTWYGDDVRPSEALFNSEETLKITLKGNLKELLRDRSEEGEYQKFSLSYQEKGNTKTQDLKIKVRGNFRRDFCKFPPLKLNFSKEGSKGSIFEGLDKVKMVVPCSQKSDKYSEFLHLEYLAYKGYNLISDSSFRVRLVETTFIDEAGKYDPFTEYTFLIEPLDELELRLNSKESEKKSVHPNRTDRMLVTKMSIYEYMIGNTDWSIIAKHNIKLIESNEEATLLPIPYDFDFSGLVGTPYAIPDPNLDIQSVRERLYRGFCQSEILTQNVVDHFNKRKDKMIELFESYPHLKDRTRKSSLKYIDKFYRITENPKLARFTFIKRCRTS